MDLKIGFQDPGCAVHAISCGNLRSGISENVPRMVILHCIFALMICHFTFVKGQTKFIRKMG